MIAPRPGALRLIAPASGGKRADGGKIARVKSPPPPFGLRAWSPGAETVALLLDARGESDARTVAGVAAQLPLASSLPGGTLLFVLGAAASGGPFAWLPLAWFPFARGVPVPRASRCSALLARGYVDIGAGTDGADADLAWGTVP